MTGSFGRYVVVGSSALALHIVVLQVLLWSIACPPWGASAAGFVAACALNYTLQRLWVFRSHRPHTAALPRYVAITTVMLGVNTLLFSVLFGLGLPAALAQTITTGCVFILNYAGNSRVTFGVPIRASGASAALDGGAGAAGGADT